MNAVAFVRALAATSSRNEKEKIITDAYLSGCQEFFICAKLAYDKLVSFGVAKVADIAEDDLNPGDPGTFSFNDFIALTNKLRKRELTGHAARDAINAAATACHGPTWRYLYRPVLLKDMKIGCDEGTINKALKKLVKHVPEAADAMIPTFDCMLAHDGEDAAHQKKIKSRKLLDWKMDGVRTLSVLDKDANKVTLFTRNGQIIETFPEVRACLERLLVSLPGSVVLDGELMSPQGFQHLMTMIKNPDRDTSMVRLALFDMVPLDDFRAGLCAVPQWKRHLALASLETTGLLREAGSKAYVIEKLEVNLDTPEGLAAFEDFNRNALENNIEGIMIKDPEAPYEAKRSSAWLKKKPVIDTTLEVIVVEEGKPDGKYVGMLGALVCRGIDNGRVIQTNVGSGFTDEQRVEIWRDREKLVGMLVEVRADKMTLESGTDVWSLRFPRFRGFRGFSPGEKI